MNVFGTTYSTVAHIDAALAELEVLSSYEQRKYDALMAARAELLRK